MPSVSKAQRALMAMVAHDAEASKRTGIPQSVAREFNQADKGRDASHLPRHVKHKHEHHR